MENIIENERDTVKDGEVAENAQQTDGREGNRRMEPQEIDYKDARMLYRYVSERGKIIPSRVNNMPIKRQREIAQAIKRARIIAIMPFISNR